MQPEHQEATRQKRVRHPFTGPHRVPIGLALARVAWVVFTLGILVVSASSLPSAYASAEIPCQGANCGIGQISVGNVAALHRLGIPIPIYELYPFVVEILGELFLLLVAFVIFWRRFDHWFTRFVSLWLVLAAGIAFGGSSSPLFSPEVSQGIGYAGVILLFPALGLFCVTFPNGRFAPRWSWIVPLLWTLQLVAFLLPPPLNISDWPGPLFPLEVLLVYGGTLGLQVYRYVRLYSAVERQQTKWLVYGLAIAVLYVGCDTVLSALLPPDSSVLLPLLPDVAVLFLSMGLGLGVAVFRFRLWDIDVIINRTLVYGSLSVTLLVVYLLLVFGGQHLLASWLGPSNPVVLVVSTLIVFALAAPLRRRVQQLIDRRFYRSTYDATRTLAEFGAMLQNEMDLETLSQRLVGVVQETMQPASVSFRLLQPGRAETLQEERAETRQADMESD